MPTLKRLGALSLSLALTLTALSGCQNGASSSSQGDEPIDLKLEVARFEDHYIRQAYEKYGNVRVRLPQDPGQAGKDQAQSFVRLLSGFSVRTEPVSGSKESRAEPVAAQWQAGNFDVVVGDWNESYFSQMESFPASKFKDMVDATSDAFSELERRSEFHFSF